MIVWQWANMRNNKSLKMKWAKQDSDIFNQDTTSYLLNWYTKLWRTGSRKTLQYVRKKKTQFISSEYLVRYQLEGISEHLPNVCLSLWLIAFVQTLPTWEPHHWVMESEIDGQIASLAVCPTYLRVVICFFELTQHRRNKTAVFEFLLEK